MGALGAILVGFVLLALFGFYVAFYAARQKYKEIFPSREDRDKLLLLHKGLKTVGFWDPIEQDNQVKYVRNAYLSRLITEAMEDGTLNVYIKRQALKIVNNQKGEITFDWLLCSDTHCIGFELPERHRKY